MSKPKHTPGPWKAIGNRIKGNTHGIFIAKLFTQHIPTVKSGAEEEKANARLIAAAPEMLEALHWALHHIEETHGIKGDELSPIKQAIAEAEE